MFLNNRPRRLPGGVYLCLELQNLLVFAEVDFYIPILQLHGAVLLQIEVHLEGAVPQLWLVPDFTLEAVSFGNFQILGQLLLVVRMGALLNDQASALLRCYSAQVGKSLLGDDAVEVVLGVVDV